MVEQNTARRFSTADTLSSVMDAIERIFVPRLWDRLAAFLFSLPERAFQCSVHNDNK